MISTGMPPAPGKQGVRNLLQDFRALCARRLSFCTYDDLDAYRRRMISKEGS